MPACQQVLLLRVPCASSKAIPRASTSSPGDHFFSSSRLLKLVNPLQDKQPHQRLVWNINLFGNFF
jgi:hypothetical protein